MTYQDGFLELFRIRRVPVRLHWLVLVLVFLQLLARRSLLSLLAFAIILIGHELGHAWMARRYRLKVHEIRIYPYAGECSIDPPNSPREDVLIAWGGVLVQFALLLVALVVRQAGVVQGAGALEFVDTFVGPNALMIAFNLLPIRPLDGHTAWQLRHLRAAPRRLPSLPDVSRRTPTPSAGPPRTRASRPASVPPRTSTRDPELSREQREAVEALVDGAFKRARTPKDEPGDEER